MMIGAFLFLQFVFFSCLLASEGTLRLLNDSLNHGASCLDGTAPGYYFSPGFGDGVSKWYIHHMGGGWCTTLNACFERSKGGLGSTKDYPATMDLARAGGYFSNNSALNPLMYNWNKVYFIYCDGSSFSSDKQQPVVFNDKKLWFRGFKNLQAYARDLTTILSPSLSRSTDVVISGCSAGGLSTFLHIDWWRGIVPKTAKVVGLQDSGFFLDFEQYGQRLRWVFKEMNCRSGVNQKCIQHNSADPAKCMFAEHTSPHIVTPIFHLQSFVDAWQITCELGKGDADSINKYGRALKKKILTTSLSLSRNGGLVDSCYHHCGCWDKIVINNYNVGEAFTTFYHTGSSKHVSDLDYPCNCCPCASNSVPNGTIPSGCWQS